jgi:hypothetical protein
MLTDSEVSELMENHVFSGTTQEWVSYDGKRTYPATDWTDEGWSAWEEHAEDPVMVEGLGPVRHVTSQGGEDQGSHYEAVYEVTEGPNKGFYKKEGRWVSHDGLYWEGDFSATKQVEKTVTVWV